MCAGCRTSPWGRRPGAIVWFLYADERVDAIHPPTGAIHLISVGEDLTGIVPPLLGWVTDVTVRDLVPEERVSGSPA